MAADVPEWAPKGVVTVSRQLRVGRPHDRPTLAPVADRSLFRDSPFTPEVITDAVWLYYRFCLSFRDVEDLLGFRGLGERLSPYCAECPLTLRGTLGRRPACG